jgi:restriction system protein
LMDQQIAALEAQFVGKGGYSEQLATERMKKRNQDRVDRPDSAHHIPAFPKCGKALALRTAKSGKNEGQQFWGCTAFPECKGTAKV